MITLTLPSGDRRALLRGFWFTGSALISAPWFTLAWWFHAWPPSVVGGATAFLVGSLVFARESFAWRVYRAWNHRLVRPFGALAGRLVMSICFYIVFVAAGRAEARESVTLRGRGAIWKPRGALPADAYRSVFAAATQDGASGAWVADYVRWARETGNLWSLSLLPFLAVLRCLALESETPSQANIYTLF